MVVYRLLENRWTYDVNDKMRNEYQDYLNGKISFPKYWHDEGINTHRYKAGINYIHFFHFYEDAVYYISTKPSIFFNNGAFIGFYDIPSDIIEKYQGFGTYPNSINSYLPVLEYAIPFPELKDEFIVGKAVPYAFIYHKSQAYQDYINGGYEKYLEKADQSDQQLMRSLIRLKRR